MNCFSYEEKQILIKENAFIYLFHEYYGLLQVLKRKL